VYQERMTSSEQLSTIGISVLVVVSAVKLLLGKWPVKNLLQLFIKSSAFKNLAELGLQKKYRLNEGQTCMCVCVLVSCDKD